MQQEFYFKYINSPIGWLQLKSTDDALWSIHFVDEPGCESETHPSILQKAVNQLEEYFRGIRKIFDVKLAPKGTEFQRRIWDLVETVPYGCTASYLDISLKSGSAKKTRAIGLANGKNPIPIIIPCHRIIGTNGKLTGYAGGLDKKRWLLQHELSNTNKKELLF
ncbi:methylated-DNA--[protein]-cysteine S-methyltransferase [Prolixibacteraceae bacterium Z1-6]|uniref:Methylated-DNA--protein-cysteine methyltransferase n=1 Tax=Draconibacterium aestuarii TaxID=2998507 RepID=A0A9X3F3E7_9BACT|nr:methylated-DNA--[protein]-cysteine S-methyltransferase [Prolixibacteraceae bacterium Z1-6]